MRGYELLRRVAVGVVGALVLTGVHQALRGPVGKTPRMDLLGEAAIKKGCTALGLPVPRGQRLHRLAFFGDLVANSLYYALVRGAAHPWRRGAALGAAAGLCALVLPGPLGLGTRPRGTTSSVQAMTMGYYLLGGLAASTASTAVSRLH